MSGLLVTPKFSALLVQDVMDTLFARRANGELFSEADEKALAHAMRRGGTRRIEPPKATIINTPLPPIATQRVPSALPPEPPCPKKPSLISSVHIAMAYTPTIAAMIRSPLSKAITGSMSVLVRFKVFYLQGLYRLTQHIHSFLYLIAQFCIKGLEFVVVTLPQLFFKQINDTVATLKRGQRYQRLNKLRTKKRALVASALHPTEPLESPEAIDFNTLPIQEESVPMSAILSSSPSYALTVLPTVAQKPELTVFMAEALPASLIETTKTAEPSVTPLMSDAAVRTLMAHHPKPESMAPHSETDRLLQHNRFLSSSINNLAERYFSLQQQH